MFSSVPIQTEMLTLTYEHPSSAYHFGRKPQANISPSDQSIEKPEEKVTPLTKSDRDKLHSDFEKYCSEMKSMNENIATMMEKLNDKYEKKIEKQIQPMLVQITDISFKQSKNIQNEVLTRTSENSSSEDNSRRKYQGNISPYNKSFEQPEE